MAIRGDTSHRILTRQTGIRIERSVPPVRIPVLSSPTWDRVGSCFLVTEEEWGVKTGDYTHTTTPSPHPRPSAPRTERISTSNPQSDRQWPPGRRSYSRSETQEGKFVNECSYKRRGLACLNFSTFLRSTRRPRL